MASKKEEELNWKVGAYDLKISHPQKIYWPLEGITKLKVLEYYKEMTEFMLPYFKNRPATVHYFPRGIGNSSFYKRDFGDVVENKKKFKTAFYKEVSQDKTIQVPIIDSQAGILWFASKGGFEFHLWSSKIPDYSKPDIAIFDLDASKNTCYERIIRATKYLNEFLLSLGISGFPKTSGGTGMHVYVPIFPEYTFIEVRNWVKKIGIALEKLHPDLITTLRVQGTTHKSSKISIDYLQNVISRNTVAPYSLRGYTGTPVSTPLSWNEIEEGEFSPLDFNIKTVPKRLKEMGDVFSNVLTSKYHLEI
ncbi:bifunctional non-homologous end joining protein LigD [Salegentibacter sp. 24]|uniref:DNA polymerase domain-containing protein n=1 Tax=Salegentibacter sp. 24 TaxID=2183986 RepID=UPI00105E0F4F|nr:hypothetical protein [Salegentibacter sp. 24]TDN83803.1 bifunctional non-homologous end joining protein LigD [Salegentibacter sp. 24]